MLQSKSRRPGENPEVLKETLSPGGREVEELMEPTPGTLEAVMDAVSTALVLATTDTAATATTTGTSG